ncbi:delta(14)-sterol reductase TM7SF2-like [Styela clava]
MRFKEGDKVMARWPGSSLYFHATIKKINEDDDSAEVLYEDGTEMDIPLNYLANESAFRRKSKSPSRGRRSRSRSPARSPARKPRQKAATSEKKKVTRRINKSLSTTTSSSSDETKVNLSPSRVTLIRSDRMRTTEQKGEEVRKVTTRSYQSKITLEKLDNNDEAKQRADTAVLEARKTIESVKKQIRHEYEFGGPFGILFQYLFTPLAIIALLSCCSYNKCELYTFSLTKIPQTLKAYYDPTAILIVVEYFLFHAFVYSLPLGQIVEGPRTYSGSKTEYRISAFYTLLLTILGYSALLYFRYPVTIIYDKLLPIATTSIVFCYVFNILIHFKSYFASESELNPRANTGCTIYDVFMGRELHPRFGRYYQLKLLVYRPGVTAWILMNLIYLQKELAQSGTIRPSLAVVSGFQIFYCVFVFFWDEAQTIYTFDIKYEGLGFQTLIGNLVIVPYIYTMHARYLVEHPKAALIPTPILVTAVALLVLGVALVLLSGYQKTYFRQNPYDPSLSALESIPPYRKGGRRLIVSGYWGFVRHPNYLGEILLGIGYGLMCGFSDVFPWIYAIFVFGLLSHRALRDEVRCQEVHGRAWDEYCRRVPYRIVPYVF